MPLFDLVCTKCNITFFDRIHKAMEQPPCPSCNTPMSKLVSKNNFKLKGDCWEKDGYK